MKTLVGHVIVAVGLLLSARDASAQDSRWEPWVGCWDLVNESQRAGVGAARASALSPDPEAGAIDGVAPRVCVTRAGDNTAVLTTTVPDQPPVEQTLVADGSSHPVADAGCRGSGRTEWSSNGQRLLARVEVTCEDGMPRSISSMGLITADDTWLEIRSFRVGGSTTTRVSRYERVNPRAARATATPGTPLTLVELKEVSTKVSVAVLEAAVAETRPDLEVNRRTLVDLDEAGVPGPVIDVVVALAYPSRFVVDRAPRPGSGPPSSGYYPFGIDDYYYSG